MPPIRLTLVVASAGWAGVTATSAVVGFPAPPLFWAGFAVTLALAGANLVAATACGTAPAARAAHVAVALGVYATAFPAAHALLGPGHFDAPPDAGPGAWAAFAVAHLLRAADALDLVRDWGAVQAVRHTSPTAAGLLVGFHLIAGAFVVDAIGRAAGRARRTLVGDMPRTMAVVLLSVFARLGLAACAAVPLGMAIGQVQNSGIRVFDWRAVPLAAAAAVGCLGLLRLATRLRDRSRVGPADPGDALGELGADAGRPLARAGAVVLAPASVALLVALVSITGLAANEIGAAGMAWWAVDQALRGADFADVMQLFDLRVTAGPALPAAVLPAVCLRAAGSAVVGVAVHRLWRLARPAPVPTR
ncbi:hypothetical protein [Urbifossiella limnaea]|uniref:Uncharacterized protein n=1 Tax=Urbifossiella limnaea TaxID=2528023 RepID=A0A517XUW2_9BACT|nr:hypothetical protein [Urbifossiella limnaea]QDU21284.1 hypothetical protein ETAA1_32500 [Urbifossiella limnaea]